jgi:hypothetical protein
MKTKKGWKPTYESIHGSPGGYGASGRLTRELLKRCHLGHMRDTFVPFWRCRSVWDEMTEQSKKNYLRNYFRNSGGAEI